MKDRRAQQLTHAEAFQIENAVRELLWKGKRKRKPFTLDSLDIAVADGAGQILCTLGMHYPTEKWEEAVRRAMGKRESYGNLVYDNGNIRVHYYDDNVDKELDAKLEKAMAGVGYSWYASGYDIPESRRDNCFEKAGSQDDIQEQGVGVQRVE